MKGISAVVATYKRKNELNRLFDSIINNNLQKIEVIVVDQNMDGLIDDVIENYSGKLDIVHLKQKEPNQSKARNFGASKAKYPVICFPDDDCWFENDSLVKVQNFFSEKPQTDVLIINWKQNPIPHNSSFELTMKHLVTFRSVGYVTYVQFYNKGIFQNLGGFLETIGIGKYIGGGEDSELIFRAASKNMKMYYDAGIAVNHNYIPVTTRQPEIIRARQRAMGLMYVQYKVPGFIIAKGLAAPLLKAAFCFNRNKAVEYYNMFLGRKEGFFHGLKNKNRAAEPMLVS